MTHTILHTDKFCTEFTRNGFQHHFKSPEWYSISAVGNDNFCRRVAAFAIIEYPRTLHFPPLGCRTCKYYVLIV